MKKHLLFFFVLFLTLKTFAQLDLEHWFAPMVDRTGNSLTYQSIYMSTNETTPFKVDIYFNNTIISTVTISKNSPVKYSIPNSQRNRIITSSQADLFTPVAMGFYLKGEKPFFASLRFSISNHGEIQTSKGYAALGKEFRAVMAPLSVNNINIYGKSISNFMNSIMAKEDNTTVTITGFQPSVRFSDNVIRTQINFTLNKGQSYIIDGLGDYSQNYTGYIGAKIVSDKPIVIANGNFNGQYAGNFSNSSDILMDQGVPIDKLGTEFVLMKGNGSTSSNMEKALIVASEDNTQIYVNDGTTPAATLNAGQYYTTNNSAYKNQGSGHYNMYIKATKNIYVYQLLAGANSSTGTEEATGGLNYIPPLSCYLPRKIDEIGKIEENEYSSNGVSYSLTVPTKLNIITEKGATIKVFRNGTPLTITTANGPYNVTGNNNWVTYSVQNITGNIAVESTHAVTAGISAGNDAVGYGGYFAGFSMIPLISPKEEACIVPGVSGPKISVTEGFDHYLWMIKNPTTGIFEPATGVNNTYLYEPQQPGIYIVKVQQGSCPEVTSKEFKFYNCTNYTNVNVDICDELPPITPSFALSTQSVDFSSVKIIPNNDPNPNPPPPKGEAKVNPDGTVTYKAYPNEKGIDTFKFSFKGIDPFPDTEVFQITVNINQIRYQDATLEECSNNGTATYKLDLADITNDTDIKSRKYYKDIALTQLITGNTITTTDTIIYAKLENNFGCEAVAKITLNAIQSPIVKPELYTQKHCDEAIDKDIDGTYKINVNTITPTILVAPSGADVKYYETLPQANIGGNDNISGDFSFTANRSIWVRVQGDARCNPVVKEIKLVTQNKIPLQIPLPINICDNDLSSSEKIYLDDYISLFTSEVGATADYFFSESDAKGNNNLQPNEYNLTGDQTFYYRIHSKSGLCDNVGKITFLFKKGTAPTRIKANYTVCQGDAITIKAEESVFEYYKWVDQLGNTILEGKDAYEISLTSGKYTVYLTNAEKCIYPHHFEVIGFPTANPDITKFNANLCDEADGKIDGIYTVEFSKNVSPAILPNFADYKMEYSLSPKFDILLPEKWTYTTPTPVYLRVSSTYCPSIHRTILFGIGDKIPVKKLTYTDEVCDDDLDGIKKVDLSLYLSQFTSDDKVTPTYYDDYIKASTNDINYIAASPDLSGTKTFYIRLSKTNYCDEIVSVTITVKVPKKSDYVEDKQICPGDQLDQLDAGKEFSSYKWSNGETTQIAHNLGIGDHWVELTYNGCVYRQNFTISSFELPIITAITIKGTTVTISVSGGKPPYQYSLDGANYQDSNVFTNVPYGKNKAYVISADHCDPVVQDFTVIRILNVITPNNDGYNDYLDYSDLLDKEDAFLKIFNRNGTIVFTGDKNNQFIWNGKQNDRIIETGSYWYVLRWRDPGSATINESKGWVLVKNRD